jgi:hypothetical protein
MDEVPIDFIRDLNRLSILLDRFLPCQDLEQMRKYQQITYRLTECRASGNPEIKHIVLQAILGRYLLTKEGFPDVRVEEELRFGVRGREVILTYDVLALTQEGRHGFEVMTGFVNSRFGRCSAGLREARDNYKTVKYGQPDVVDSFSIAVPWYYVLQVDGVFALPPDERDKEGIERVKELCDWYVRETKREAKRFFSKDDIRNAKLDFVYLIDARENRIRVKKIPFKSYAESRREFYLSMENV